MEKILKRKKFSEKKTNKENSNKDNKREFIFNREYKETDDQEYDVEQTSDVKNNSDKKRKKNNGPVLSIKYEDNNKVDSKTKFGQTKK